MFWVKFKTKNSFSLFTILFTQLFLSFAWICFTHTHLDVYEESEADLMSERNNNDTYRSSRSPDGFQSRATNYDRKLSSGYFVWVKGYGRFFFKFWMHHKNENLFIIYVNLLFCYCFLAPIIKSSILLHVIIFCHHFYFHRFDFVNDFERILFVFHFMLLSLYTLLVNAALVFILIYVSRFCIVFCYCIHYPYCTRWSHVKTNRWINQFGLVCWSYGSKTQLR